MRKTGNLLLIVVSLVVALGLVEVVLRAYYLGQVILPDEGPAMFVPHPTRSFVYRPDIDGHIRQFDAIVPYRINKAGYRGPELDEPKRRYRIVVLGDSAVAGSGVSNEDLFTVRLERALGADRVEVINAGTPAYNAAQILLALRETVAALKPDLVIFGFAPVNDIQGGERELRKLFKAKYKRAVAYMDEAGTLKLDLSAAKAYYERNKDKAKDTGGEPFITQLVLFQIIKQVVKSATKAELNDPNVLLGWPFLAAFSPEYSTRNLNAADYQKLWDGGWTTMKAIFEAARRDSEAAGAHFAVMAMPGKVQVVEEMRQSYLAKFANLKFDTGRINRELAAFAADAGMVHIDLLTPMLKARDAGTPALYHKIDHHLAAGGHGVLAETLADALKRQGLLSAQ